MSKIRFESACGKQVELEVSEQIAELTVEFRVQDENYKRKMRRRKEKSIEEMAEYGAEIEDNAPPIDETIEQQAQYQELHKAIEKLSPKQQQLVDLRYFRGLSVTEIARQKGVDRTAISHQLATIHKKIKLFLEKSSRL
jgi:RNA polymerase sigma-70 factor (ECF subfamily)